MPIILTILFKKQKIDNQNTSQLKEEVKKTAIFQSYKIMVKLKNIEKPINSIDSNFLNLFTNLYTRHIYSQYFYFSYKYLFIR